MLLNIRVIPNAARDEVVGWQDGVLKVKVRAVAEDGKANKAVCQLLAKDLKCRPREILIKAGERGRNKQLEIPLEKDLHSVWG